MSAGEVRICPMCRGEYRPEIVRCASCDIDLVAPGHVPHSSDDLPPDLPGLVVLRVEAVDWCRRLLDDLAGEGIPARLDLATDPSDCSTRSCAIRYAVRVRQQDAARARMVDEARVRREIPGWDDDDEAGEPADDRCPACGERVATDAESCPACELVLEPPQPD